MKENIVIALEPEAASVYCQSNGANCIFGFKKIMSENNQRIKYLVVDIGGNLSSLDTKRFSHQKLLLKQIWLQMNFGVQNLDAVFS